ncbi:MAG: hypothetical protein K2X29_07365 [Candidatus Obscuribacterales bacterium]|nr:hypothetical protein [Candidatus Obscuribacterales bacterium]
MALANISLLISLDTLSDTSNLTGQSLDYLTQKLAVGGISSLIGLALTVWSLTLWLNRLTAFCRFRLFADPGNPEKKKLAVKTVISEVAQNQKMLCQFWFIFSLFLLVPVVPLTILVLLETLVHSPTLQALNLIKLPGYMNAMLNVGILIFTVVSAAMTVVATATVSKLNLHYKASSLKAVKLFVKRGLIICLATAIVLLVNALISAPQSVLQLIASAGQSSPTDLLAGVVGQVWLALTSSMLWTISLCPVLEILRRDLVAA